ncbi:MAG: helix-turn-helix transcriptional regulator [Bacteroidales bacterium]|nr:helix-turn-helix transcriptional regulator [Bacteroidales bacterium]
MEKVNEQVVKEARKRIGSLFRERRKQLGYTQKDVADFCGVSYQTINKVEVGAFPYSLDLVFKISVILRLTINFEEKDEGEMRRFLLQPGSRKNSYIVTDRENGIVCEFVKGKFNETQHFTLLGDDIIPVNKMATVMREFADFLSDNYRELI